MLSQEETFGAQEGCQGVIVMMVLSTPPSSQTIVVEAQLAKNAVEGCSLIPGFSSGDVDADAKYLLLGQAFGTVEFTAQFGNIICALSSARPLVVALPYSARYSHALSAYIADPHDDADKALLALPIWDKSEADGRSSSAMFRLIRLLRGLRLSGRDIKVAAYWPSIEGDDNAFQTGMADQLKSISESSRLIVAMMAGLHSGKKPYPTPRNIFPPNMIDPAADRLPKEQVISIHFESKGGSAWGWRGPHKVPVYGGGLTLWSRYDSTVNGFDGRLFVGILVTPSAPLKQ